MILVDSSVWISYFNGTATPGAEKLSKLLKGQSAILQGLASEWVSSPAWERIAVADLILTEVLQGFRDDREYLMARRFLKLFDSVDLGGQENAIQAANNFRALRKKGVTVRKTIDTLIATRCIESGYELLYDDRDFDPFVQHLGLRAVS
ncbi:MAG TPA: PIN domain nuclease [Bryobacteraceae bacterium]|nr:PIN domain nuclease [Bryobacteraceae bacterium]